ncbi:hypothetical protein KEM54_005383 [Ascosphaera aggregata]|nr:hypothetical protein KEM54_005383 [Ascosphaera aggregata]
MMHPLLLTSAVLSSFLAPVFASSQSLDIYQWPLLSTESPDRLLSVNYDAASAIATVSSYLPPTGEATDDDDDALIRIGTLNSASGKWTGTLTRRSILQSKKTVILNLYVDTSSSQIYDVSLSTVSSSRDARGGSPPEIKIIPSSSEPVPTLSQPVPTKPDGSTLQQVPEKTFLQKYWWVFVAMAFIGLLGNGEQQS